MRSLFVFCFLLGFAVAQEPKGSPKQDNSVPEISADMGDCTADFHVTDTKMRPLYRAKLMTRIKYGFAGLRKLDLEISTNADGQARFIGLPGRPREPLSITANFDGRSTVVIVSPIQNCHGSYKAIVTDRPVDSSAPEGTGEK